MTRALGRTAILLGVAAIVAAVTWWVLHDRTPPPPDIQSLGNMAPEVAALLTELRQAIEDEPEDPERWGRFAIACEANGLVGAARQGYERSIALAPTDPRWTYRLALVAS